MLLFFGRPDTVSKLLSVYELLFGNKLPQHQVIAAHYTWGADVNQTSAEQFAEESFKPIQHCAHKLQVQIDKRYRVTDNLVSDMISTTKEEAPDILLLGAGPRFMTDGKRSITSFFGLFRKKVDDVLEQVSCPVAVFVNRHYEMGKEVSVLINGTMDKFLFPCIERILKDNTSKVNLYYFQGSDDPTLDYIQKLSKQYVARISLFALHEISDLRIPAHHSLLMLGYDTCLGIAADEEIFQSLPSLLVIKDAEKI